MTARREIVSRGGCKSGGVFALSGGLAGFVKLPRRAASAQVPRCRHLIETPASALSPHPQHPTSIFRSSSLA